MPYIPVVLSELLSSAVFLSPLYLLILDVGGIFSILLRTAFTSRVFLLSGAHFLDHYLKAFDSVFKSRLQTPVLPGL